MKFEGFGRKGVGQKEALKVQMQELLDQMKIGEPTTDDRHKLKDFEERLQGLLGDDTSVEEYLNSPDTTSADNDNENDDDNTGYPIRSTA